MKFFLKLFLLLSFCLFFPYCCKQVQHTSAYKGLRNNEKTGSHLQNFKVKISMNSERYRIGDTIHFIMNYPDPARKADSLIVKINGRKIAGLNGGDSDYHLMTLTEIPGKKNVTFVAYYANGVEEDTTLEVILLSDIVPDDYTYRMVGAYNHDKKAYTQGLIFDEGIMYEGTGLSGMSSLRQVNPETGEKLRIFNLPPDVFGEGIASVGDFIYQLTYHNQVVFKYDKHTFEMVGQFTYPMSEGWGLTYDGKDLIMADGSNQLFFIDPVTFSEIRRVEVYDNLGPRDKLNELEYIHGAIWANIYTTDSIVSIQPETGKILGHVVLKDLVQPQDRHEKMDCLNGIAYDAQNDKLFVTGKNWAKLYEVKFVKK